MAKKRKTFQIKTLTKSKAREISTAKEEGYPKFCFRYLSDKSLKKCKDADFLRNFILRLQKLSASGWEAIGHSPRHSFGMEKIPRSEIIPQLPSWITHEVSHLHVFRAVGDNRPFVGLRIGSYFRILFIETKFGEIYDHKT